MSAGATPDHYEVLQISRSASDDVIRAAYRSLMKVHHPDRGGDLSVAAAIHEAYATLSDPDLRRGHDAALQAVDDERDAPDTRDGEGTPLWGEVVDDEPSASSSGHPGSAPPRRPAPSYVVPSPASGPPPAVRMPRRTPNGAYAPPPGASLAVPRLGWWRTAIGITTMARVCGAVWLVASLAPLFVVFGTAILGLSSWADAMTVLAYIGVPVLVSVMIGVRRARSGARGLYVTWVVASLLLLAGAVLTTVMGTVAWYGWFTAYIALWVALYIAAVETRVRAARRA
ncbi:J domain-containing protein [Streptomyces sp. MS2A]|nr:J domain-containing protein [Streptomyces sp. MS2A]